MIDVNVVLPGGKREKGRVDPTQSLDDLLRDIVEAFNLGNPNEYEIAIVPISRAQAWQGLRPSQGDTIWIIPHREAKGKAFIPG